MLRGLVLLVACACGRIGFDARGDGGGTDAFAGCPVISAAAGRNHTCAVDRDGRVWCFGTNVDGQVLPGGPLALATPTHVPLAGPAAQIVTGRGFSCARLADGQVQCWGSNAEGKLGNGTLTGTGPTFVSLGSERAIDLVSSSRSACIRRASDGAV